MHVCVCMSHTSVHVAEVQEGHLVLLYSLGKGSPLEKELDCRPGSPSDPLILISQLCSDRHRGCTYIGFQSQTQALLLAYQVCSSTVPSLQPLRILLMSLSQYSCHLPFDNAESFDQIYQAILSVAETKKMGFSFFWGH